MLTPLTSVNEIEILKLVLIFGILANDKIAVDWITKYGNDFKLTALKFHYSFNFLNSLKEKFSVFIVDSSLQFL